MCHKPSFFKTENIACGSYRNMLPHSTFPCSWLLLQRLFFSRMELFHTFGTSYKLFKHQSSKPLDGKAWTRCLASTLFRSHHLKFLFVRLYEMKNILYTHWLHGRAQNRRRAAIRETSQESLSNLWDNTKLLSKYIRKGDSCHIENVMYS